MKRSTGDKIILWAVVLWGMSLTAAFLGGVALIAALMVVLLTEESVLLVFGIGCWLLVAALSLYLTGLLLRGYGEMVNNSRRVSEKADVIIDRLTELCDGIESDPEE